MIDGRARLQEGARIGMEDETTTIAIDDTVIDDGRDRVDGMSPSLVSRLEALHRHETI